MYLIGLGVFFAIFFGIGIVVMGESFGKFVAGFTFVFLVTILSYGAANQATMRFYGIGYAAWAILFGILISNTVGTPKWVIPAVQVEYYIKTGLVLLGAKTARQIEKHVRSFLGAIGLPRRQGTAARKARTRYGKGNSLMVPGRLA